MPRRLALLLLLAACKRDAAATATPPAACPPTADAPMPGDPDPLREPERQRRLRGLAALDAGRHDLARAEFAAILAVAPDNLGARALFEAATRALLAAQEAAAERFAARVPTPLPAPPWRHTVRAERPVAPDRAPRLTRLSARPNGAADEIDWLRAHDLRLPEYEVPNPMQGLPGNLPPGIPPTHGNDLLVLAIARDDHTILLYGPDYSGGRHLAVQDRRGRLLAFLDYTAYRRAPDTTADQRVQCPAIADALLYLAHHDPRDPRGQTAYLTALDLATGELRWRSDPQVASAFNFVLDGAHVLTAHGAPDEPAHLVALERRTGKQVARAPLDSPPEYLFVRDRRLLLRTRDTAYEFALR